MFDGKIEISLHPHEGKILVLFSLCQTGHFGNRNGSWVFGPDWIDGRSIACLDWVCKGVLHWSPWENRLTFKLWHPGHNSRFGLNARVYSK